MHLVALQDFDFESVKYQKGDRIEDGEIVAAILASESAVFVVKVAAAS